MSIIDRIDAYLAPLTESKILDNAKAIIRRTPAPDPRDALAHAAVDWAERHRHHTGESLDPKVAAHVALAEVSGLVNNGVHDVREPIRDRIRTEGTPERHAMQTRIASQNDIAHLFQSHTRMEPDERAAVRTAAREHLEHVPSVPVKMPTDHDVEYAATHAHDPKHVPMAAAIFAHHLSGYHTHGALRMLQTGKVAHAYNPTIGQDAMDEAARVHEGIAKARDLVKRGLGRTPDRDAAAKDVLAHDPVMAAPKALAAWHRHRNTIEAWGEDLPLRHQPHEMGQAPVAENETHRVYRIDDAHQAGLKCWRPDGQNTRYCLTAPGSGEYHLKQHYRANYPFFIATRKSEAGEHLAGAYIPSMLHSHPTEGLRNAENDGPLVGENFEALHPLLSKAHPAVDEVAHKYREGGEIDRQHARGY